MDSLGLKRGAVGLCEHQISWKLEAERAICRLREILGDLIRNIQHIGSTAIPGIKAKPIIDIALCVEDFEAVLAYESELQNAGFHYRPSAKPEGQLLFACGSFYEGTGDLQTHFIHVVKTGSMQWIHYINFRDQLRADKQLARAYERLKCSLADRLDGENAREDYVNGKHNFISQVCRKALVRNYLGKVVDIIIDRALGSVHPKHPDLVYPVNYGYLPGIFAGDGEELDVYLLGVPTPVQHYSAKVIGIVHRRNDTEDKLIAAPEGLQFSPEEMLAAVWFQEQYFQSEIEV